MMSATAQSLKRGFRTVEAAQYIGRSASWLRKKRLSVGNEGREPGPRYLKTEGGAIYLREDLDAWLDLLASRAGVVASTANAA
jgi:hypothetical protein